MQLTQRLHKHDRFRTLALLMFAGLFLALASPALAAGEGSGRSWGAFMGRMHVLILHLPIGLLAGAFTIESVGLLKQFKRSKGFDIAAACLFILGALASIGAVSTGLLYGTEKAAANSGKEAMTIFQLLGADSIEQGVTETLGWHMWLGITLMVAAITAAVFKVIAVRKQWCTTESETVKGGGWTLAASRVALLGAMTALPFAGHLGGNMTHGQEFLFERTPIQMPEAIVRWPEPAEDTATTQIEPGNESEVPDGSVAAWVTVIQPALDTTCIKCHGTTKKNGGIRLDSLKYASEGEGLDYPVITAGDAQFSAMHTVITLPKTHDLFMPPAPKSSLDPEMVAFIGEWIQNYDGRLEDPEATKPEADDTGDAEN